MIIAFPSPRKCLFIALLCFFSLYSFSQQKTKYSLLWRISGKGLTKPSYLFGTMHVKDRRVFNFSDSVMLSIQNCNRFALEVHPDTLISKMFAMMQNNDSLHNTNKLLNKEQYAELAKKFEKKNGFAMGNTNPMVLESMMTPDDGRADDAVSFIDAYLYGIARTLNKGIYGLEDAASQLNEYDAGEALKERLLGLLDDDTQTAMDEGKEQMIKLYSTGNLDAIYKFASENNMIDSSIIARNKVMAASMMTYMNGSSLFTAVGAAHLPGPYGVIALLRNAGYTITAVPAAFTGVAALFHIDYMKMDWPVYRSDAKGFAAGFPGKPIKYHVGNQDIITYPDMANEVYYGEYQVTEGNDDKPANRASIMAKIFANLTKNKKNIILSKKEFTYHNLPCTEVLLKSSTGYSRMRYILFNDILYCVYVGSKANHIKQPYTDRFLNSFEVFAIPQKPAEPWTDFSSTEGSFTVKLPLQPQVMAKEVPTVIGKRQVSFKMNLIIANDSTNLKLYILRYNDYPSGTFLKDKEALFGTISNEFKTKGVVIGAPVKIWQDNLEGRELKIKMNGGYNATIRLYTRGNRVYMLFKEMLLADVKDDNKDHFFDSFHLLPFKEPEYYIYKPDSGLFKVQLPTKPYTVSDSTAGNTDYLTNIVTSYATNPNSGGVYIFEHSKISPYYRISGVDSLYSRLIKRLAGYRDSVLKTDTVTCNGIKGREILLLRKLDQSKARTRMFVNGEDAYFLTGRLGEPELFDATSNHIYNSLVINPTGNKNAGLPTSKAALITSDMSSSDTLTSKKALGALAYYKFTPAEFPLVYKTLERDFPDDSASTGTRSQLIAELRKVGNDSTAMFLASLYQSLKNYDNLKSGVLHALPALDKKMGYETYLKLLTANPPVKTTEPYDVIQPLLDSVEFAVVNFDKVLLFNKYATFRPYTLRLFKNIAGLKNPSYNKLLETHYPEIMTFADADLKKYVTSKDDADLKYDMKLFYYFDLMKSIKNKPLTNRLTSYYLTNDGRGTYALNAVLARLANALPCNSLIVSRFLDSIDSRYDIMEGLYKVGQQDKVPLKYRSQAEFAKLCLYQEISTDDYGSPVKMNLLGSILKNGGIYYAFKYNLPELDENSTYVGITGPYQPSAKINFDKYNAYTAYDVLKTNWRTQAEKLIPRLKDAYK